MCAPAAVIVPIVSAVATAGLGIYSAYSSAQSAQEQATYNYQIQQQQAQYQFAEQQRQMDYQFQEQLRMAEYTYQNQMAQRDFEYRNAFVQYDYQLAEQQRQYQYELAVNQQNFEYQQAQVEANRAYEQAREEQQKSIMELNSELAGIAYGNDLRMIDLRFMQEEEAAAQQKLKASREVAQERAAVRASGRTGNTVENLLADYYRQQASFDYATNRNLAFTGADLQEQKRGSQATYAARKAAEQPYIRQLYVDPIKGQALAPGGGVAPVYGAAPVRQQVTRGTVTMSPTSKAYVNTTPYVIQGIQAGITGVANTVTAVDNYNYYKKTGKLPGRS
jgi:hypothetical protein